MTERNFYGQRRNKPILALADAKKMYPEKDINSELTKLGEHSYLPSTYTEETKCLKKKLLDFAGVRVLIPQTEEDLEKLMSRGQFWFGEKALLQLGEPSQCHANSSYLWDANRDKLRICTGYALSKDGIWRQHSWCIWAKPGINKIVETTEKRLLYFGFVMTTDECEEFLSWY